MGNHYFFPPGKRSADCELIIGALAARHQEIRNTLESGNRGNCNSSSPLDMLNYAMLRMLDSPAGLVLPSYPL